MQKLIQFAGIALMALLSCCGQLQQVESHPPEKSVYHKRFYRRHPSPYNSDEIIYEVRDVYYVLRTSPRPKIVRRISDEEMDLRVRCDFEPELSICKESRNQLSSSSTASSSTSTSTSTTTTFATPTTTSTTTSTTQPTTTTTTEEDRLDTTTELLLLPELPDENSIEETTAPTETTETTTSGDDYDFGIDDTTDDLDSNNNADIEDDLDYKDDSEYGETSIGGNDPSK